MASHRIVSLLGCTFQQIEEKHLLALISANVGEDQDLDFKQARYDHGPKGTFEIAKDVAAMANQVGGLIVLGIAEDSQACAAAQKPVVIDDKELGRMLTVMADRVHPMVAGVAVRIIPSSTSPGLGYYLIDVPHSISAPHGVRHLAPETHWICYPLRHGTTTIYLTEAQIAARYRDRFELANQQVNRLQRLHTEAPRQPSTDAVLLALGVVPAIPGNRPLSGDGPTIHDYLINVWKPGNTRIDPVFGRYEISRRRLRSIGNALSVELHADGSAWAQMSVGRTPGQGVCVIELPELEQTAVILLSMLGGYTAWSGAAGDCAIGAWLYGGPRVIRLQGPVSAEPIGLPRTGAETTAQVEQLAGDSTEVGQVVYPLVRDLEQDMGTAEPELLRPDGTFASR